MRVWTLYIQETISKKLYTIHKKPKSYFKSSLHSVIMVLAISAVKDKLATGEKTN